VRARGGLPPPPPPPTPKTPIPNPQSPKIGFDLFISIKYNYDKN